MSSLGILIVTFYDHSRCLIAQFGFLRSAELGLVSVIGAAMTYIGKNYENNHQ